MSKAQVVYDVCQYIECGQPNPGEEAFDWIYGTYMEGVNYARDGEDYPIEELIENQVPYNNYTVATIWTELQLYNNGELLGGWGTKSNDPNFIKQFQYMLYDVAKSAIYVGRSVQNKKGFGAEESVY